MSYLGTKPANSPLTSELIPDGIITPADLSQGKPVWDANGNVGIGTSSPSVRTQIESSANSAPVTLLRLNNAGNTSGGPGIASRVTFTAGATSLGFIQGSNYSSGIAGLQLSGDGANVHATLDNSGNLHIGATSSPGVQGIGIKVSTNPGNPMVFYNSSSVLAGYISVNNATTSYVTTSDYRLKENVQPLTGALAKVSALKPCTYTWKADNSTGEGFIAHELAEVCPDAVSGEKDAVFEDGSIKPQGIDTSFLVATLTAAIQEQQVIITELKARIEALESK